MVSLKRIALCFILSLVPSFAAGEKIVIGGPRKESGVVEKVAGVYQVSVRFLRVKTFDSATNERLNQDKGRILALRVLARHLAGSRPVHLTVQRPTINAVELNEDYCSLVVQIPEKGLALRDAVTKRPQNPSKVPSPTSSVAGLKDEKATIAATDSLEIMVGDGSKLFTRKNDFLETLGQLADGLKSDLQAAEKKNVDSSTELFVAISEIEERSETVLKTAVEDSKADLLLNFVEQEEIAKAASIHQEKLIEVLSAAARRAEQRARDQSKGHRARTPK